MSDEMRVRHLGNDRFAIDVRGHTVTVDQPMDAGGEDTAMTPTELFMAGLASCVGFYARRYLARHAIAPEGLEVAADYTLGGRPARVTDITIRITAPAALTAERREAFLAHCTVHNTLAQIPPIDIRFEEEETS